MSDGKKPISYNHVALVDKLRYGDDLLHLSLDDAARRYMSIPEETREKLADMLTDNDVGKTVAINEPESKLDPETCHYCAGTGRGELMCCFKCNGTGMR